MSTTAEPLLGYTLVTTSTTAPESWGARRLMSTTGNWIRMVPVGAGTETAESVSTGTQRACVTTPDGPSRPLAAAKGGGVQGSRCATSSARSTSRTRWTVGDH